MVFHYFNKFTNKITNTANNNFLKKKFNGVSASHNIGDSQYYLSNFNLSSINDNSIINPKQIYEQNVIVHRCVNLISTSASHIPWKIYKINSQGNKILHNTHIVNNILQNPSNSVSRSHFFSELISNLLLYGNSYVINSYFLLQNNIHELFNLHPSNIEIIINSDNDSVFGYKLLKNYNNFIKKNIYKIKEDYSCSILHIKNYNPDNTNPYGLSPIKTAAKATQIQMQIFKWNKALLNNISKPSGALSFADNNHYLTDEQFNRLKEQFFDNYTGASNSGKPLILEGGLKWQEANNAEKFEKFIELKDSTSRDIALAFNVPPQLLGINGDNTYSNMQEARLALWEENLIPLLNKIGNSLSNWFSNIFKEKIFIEIDKDAISALSRRRESIWAKLSDANFMTINEKRNLIGLPSVKDGEKINYSK